MTTTTMPWLLWIIAALFVTVAAVGGWLTCRDTVRRLIAIYRRRRATRALIAQIQARR